MIDYHVQIIALNNAATDVQGSTCHFPYLPVKRVPGDVVIAVGRFGVYKHKRSKEIMAAPGRYRCVQLQSNTCFYFIPFMITEVFCLL
jgi:hypothetical protein